LVISIEANGCRCVEQNCLADIRPSIPDKNKDVPPARARCERRSSDVKYHLQMSSACREAAMLRT
jgi:hypothetical protein